MKIYLYNTKSSNNTLDKVLENETEFDIKFKAQASRTQPTVVLYSETMIDFNYAHIPDFNRYYFIENVEVTPNKIYVISLRCDVLESFKEDIKKSSGYINQQITNILILIFKQKLKKKLMLLRAMSHLIAKNRQFYVQ